MRTGRPKRTERRNCYLCGTSNTYINKSGLEVWRKGDGEWFCTKDWDKYFINPLKNPINHARRITFKDKQVLIKRNPRSGICSSCGKKGITDMHHLEYHDDDPLKDTVELCKSCHMQETWRIRKLDKLAKNVEVEGLVSRLLGSITALKSPEEPKRPNG
jgi:hypothetical protein